MGIFAKWRERYAPIRLGVNFLKTPWYPVLFAVLCVIGGTHSHTVYVPVLWIMTAIILFSVLFTDDNKVFLTPLLMIFFTLGQDTASDSFLESDGDMLSFMDGGAFVQVIIICTICVGSFIARLFLDGSVASFFKRKRHFTWGIIIMDIAFLTNGLFSPVYDPVNLGIGAFLAMGFTIVYFLVLGMLEKSENPATYACYAMLATAYAAFLQMLTVVVRLAIKGDYFILFKSIGELVINRNELTLGWGVTTVVAAVFVLGIPAAMYLAKDHKFSLFSYASAILFILGTLMINVRSAMAVGILTFVIFAVWLCFKGKNRKLIRIYLGGSAVLAIVVLILADRFVAPLPSILEKLSSLLRFSVDLDSGRGKLWANGISDFLSSPVFGVGFNDGGLAETARQNNFFSNMYHCILVELPGAMGIFGCAAFILHSVQLATLCFKRFSLRKTLLLFIPIMIIGASLVDNFFFYLHFQIFYGAFLAVAEHYHDSTSIQNTI